MLQPEQTAQFRKFLVINLAVCFLLFIIYGLAFIFLPEGYLSPMTPFIILFFTATNLLIFYYKFKILKSKNSKFINLFLILNSLKLLLFITIIALYAFFFRNDAVNFAVGFFVCYVIFTTILVSYFNRLQKLA